MIEQAKRVWHGTMGVDWQDRIDFARMRRERLAKMQATMKKYGVSALIATSTAGKRYCTGIRSPEHVGPGDSFVIVFADDPDFVVYEVPAIYYHEKGKLSWVKPENYRIGPSFWSLSTGPSYREDEGKRVAKEIYDELKKRGLVKDITEAVVKNFKVEPESVTVDIVEYNRENLAKAGQLFMDR